MFSKLCLQRSAFFRERYILRKDNNIGNLKKTDIWFVTNYDVMKKIDSILKSAQQNN